MPAASWCLRCPVSGFWASHITAQNPDAGGVARQTQQYHYPILPPAPCLFPRPRGSLPFPSFPQEIGEHGRDCRSPTVAKLPPVHPQNKRRRSILMPPKRAALLGAALSPPHVHFSPLDTPIQLRASPAQLGKKAARVEGAESYCAWSLTVEASPTQLSKMAAHIHIFTHPTPPSPSIPS